MQPSSNEFDETLDDAETSLSEARDLYESITETDTAPEAFIHAITELEGQIDDLAANTRVSDADQELANQTEIRAELLVGALRAFQERQRTLAARAVARFDPWLAGLENIPSTHEIPESLEKDLSEVKRKHGVLEKLLAAEQYAQVVTNKRITPFDLENGIRRLDTALRTSLSSDAYATVCLAVLEEYLDRIHEVLASLDEENPRRTSFRTELREVKDLKSTASNALDSGDNASAAEIARTALEGGVMIEFLLSRAEAQQRLAVALSEYLQENGFVSEDVVAPHAAQADTDALVDVISEAIGTEVEATVETRIKHLLEESDGSLRRTIERADLAEETILEHVTNMYANRDIADIIVEFDE